MRGWKPKFLAALAASPNVSAAAGLAGITRRAVYAAREADPDFAAAWDEALEQSTDHLVGEAYRRAFLGTKRPVFYKGGECGSINEFSDALTVFLLKAHRPAIYRETSKPEQAGLTRPLAEVLAEARAAAAAYKAEEGPVNSEVN